MNIVLPSVHSGIVSGNWFRTLSLMAKMNQYCQVNKIPGLTAQVFLCLGHLLTPWLNSDSLSPTVWVRQAEAEGGFSTWVRDAWVDFEMHSECVSPRMQQEIVSITLCFVSCCSQTQAEFEEKNQEWQPSPFICCTEKKETGEQRARCSWSQCLHISTRKTVKSRGGQRKERVHMRGQHSPRYSFPGFSLCHCLSM